ncbi:hypothetical protein C7N83_13785 [Neisseria iguanae]|uniref:Transposase n=1 Tax=Neisseria iguanae TaxID=90242 RepID=A0A2P7TWS8_9NEIS|nr:hypothetical protein C7N83_13785 [Neisseria iguanae]
MRSVYRRLKNNLDYLFVFEQFPDSGICNTTNLPDGCFTGLKQKLRYRQGMRKANRIGFIKDYFSNLAED